MFEYKSCAHVGLALAGQVKPAQSASRRGLSFVWVGAQKARARVHCPMPGRFHRHSALWGFAPQRCGRVSQGLRPYHRLLSFLFFFMSMPLFPFVNMYQSLTLGSLRLLFRLLQIMIEILQPLA